MLEAALSAQRFVEGVTREQVEDDEMRLFAIVRALEVIGEAAAHVSADTRALIPRIPWPKVVGLRHRLIHAYFEIDTDRLWDTLTLDIEPLIEALREAIPRLG